MTAIVRTLIASVGSVEGTSGETKTVLISAMVVLVVTAKPTGHMGCLPKGTRGETKGSIGRRTAGCRIHWLLPCNWIPLRCHTIFGFEVSCIHSKS